jgi:hypothetical protein
LIFFKIGECGIGVAGAAQCIESKRTTTAAPAELLVGLAV